MVTKAWRHWGPLTVVATVVAVGLGLGLAGAPAGDLGGNASLPQAGADSTAATSPASAPRAPRSHKEGATTIAGPKREASAPAIGDRSIRMARIISAVPIGPAPSAVGSSGVLAAVACDCDDDCGPPSGPCKLPRCNSNTGQCEEVDALFGARCDLDSNYCTNDRCDGVGGCVANPLSPCSHHCVGGSRNGEDCVTHADCPGVTDGCTPDGTCDNASQTCALSPDIGRCCLTDYTCTHVTKANCDTAGGKWLRVQDSEADLDHCVCPKYGSGIAPRDAQTPVELGVCSVGGAICSPIGSSCGGTGTCVNRNPVGPVTRAPKSCSIDGKPCEDATLDCARRCSNDSNVTCLADADCGTGNTCDPQTCNDNPNACHGLLSVGDDYTLANSSYLRLREFRFRGGVRSPKETLVFEFYDNSATPLLVGSFGIRFTNGGNFYYNLEVDCAPECDAQEDQVPRDPPLIIPPVGHVVIRSDRDNADPDTQDEHSEGFWIAADDGTDVGGNDADRMWIGGNKNTNHLGTGRNVLAFELVGEKVPDPLGACCDPNDPQNCQDTHEWECRTCVGGPFDGQLCKDFRDCGGVTQGSCTSVNWQGQRLLADPPGLLCAAGPCDIGACCLANGTCEERDESQCTNPDVFQGFGTSCTPNCCDQPVATGGDCCADTLLCSDGSGTGTCTQVGQACGAGGTCQLCDGPTVLYVTVPAPDPQDPPVILRTMSGDSTSASFDVLEGDTCAQGANDPGWYEAIHVDKCAELTVDLCCNAPVVSPTWIILFDSCPCDQDTNSVFPDTRRSGYGPSDADGPNEAAVICADENWSGTWTVRAGTYWFQIFAGKVCANTVTDCDTNDDCEVGVPCEDNRGPYQLHFTVTPCPEAACCLIDTQTCVPFLNRHDCEDRLCRGGADNGNPCITSAECTAPGTCLEGVWLGDLDPTPSPDCFPTPTGTCGLGACCTGPGACDDNNGAGVSLTTCQQNQGVYHGGLRCVDEPCPVCPFEDVDHCQLDDPDGFVQASDRRLNRRLADDFEAQDTTVNRICWEFSFNPPQNPPGLPGCSDDPPDDHFIVKFYEDNLGLPGTLIATYDPLVPDAKAQITGTTAWNYSAPLSPVLSVSIQTCYWMEITAEGTGVCTTNWVSSADGNSYSARDANASWGPEDRDNADYVYCLNSGIRVPNTPGDDGGCGDLPVACCRPGFTNNCDPSITSLSACAAVNGIGIPHATCGAGVCPQPDNNVCSTGRQLICDAAGTGEGTRIVNDLDIGVCVGNPDLVCSIAAQNCIDYLTGTDFGPCGPSPSANTYRCKDVITDNRLASTDGPGNPAACSNSPNAIKADVWYEWTAECTGVASIDMCNAATYDSMLIAYTGGTGTCICPTHPTQQMVECNDDYCFGQFSTTSFLSIDVVKDRCYTLRVGGWSPDGTDASAGQSISELDIRVACDAIVAPPPPLPAPAPHNRAKNRYLSFKPDPTSPPVKFMVRRTFPGPALDIGWVGNPDTNGISAVLPLGQKPNVRSWTEPVIHTGDCEIFPWPESATSPLACAISGAPCSVMCGTGQCPSGQGECVAPPPKYEILATVDNVVFSAPLEVVTVFRPCAKKWGDSVGDFSGGQWTPPNGVSNVNDFVSALQCFQSAATKPHVSVCDVVGAGLAGLESCVNKSGNIADVFNLIKAFQGNSYPAYVCSTSGHGCSNLGSACSAPGVGTCVLPTGSNCPACP